MASASAGAAAPAAPNPFRMLSISRQAENKNPKPLRFTLRNNIQMHTVGEAQMSTFREVIDDAIGKESQIIGTSEMFEILGRSGLDEDLLAWVWEHTSTVTFVTVGPQANDDGTFSREQGIVALYLAQAQAGLEPSDFSKKLMPSHNFSAASSTSPAASSSDQKNPIGSDASTRVTPSLDDTALRSFQDEQPGLEVSDFQSNDDLITPRFDKQPGLETVQPDLEPVQPGLEAFQPTRTHATPNNTNSSMSGLGTYDQSRQPTGSNAPELYESSMSVQPRPVSTLPQNREGTPHRHSSSLAAVSQSGSSPQIERRGNDTSPSTSPRAGYRGTAAIKPPTEMLGTVDGSTTKDLGIALLVKHQAHEDKVKAKAEAEAAQGKWKWSSFKGTLGGSKRRSRNSGTIKYSDATLTAALEEAATMGSLHLVEFCLSQGGDVNYITAPAKDKYGNDIVRPRNRALIKAVEKNHVAVVQYLATKCDRTTLSLGFLAAVRRSNIDIAKMLISKGADVNYIDITDPEKPCALGLAIHNKDDEARSELLGILYGRKNLKVNVRVNGWAPLVWMIAHKSLHLEAMDLLRAGADVNFLSTDDEGPLYAACEDGYVEWVQRLLDRGAEVSVFSNKGDSPLGAASANENLEIMNLLVAQGATTKDINHSFNVAARDGKLEALKLLKENGADFNNGSVIEASKHGQMHCLRYLIHCGADFNDSSLHMAVERGMWEAVELHLELGADMFTCATGTQYKFRTKGLGSKTHSVLHHLLNCPNRNVEYRAVLAKLPSRINQLDPQFLIDAVIYLDDDILKWTLRKFPSQKNNINTKVFDDSNDSKFINLLWWVDKKLGLVGYRKYHREPKYEARLLAVKAVLLSFGAKRLCFEYFGNEAPSGFKESCHRLPFCFEA